MGINLARNSSINLSKDKRLKAIVGASLGTSLGFIPIASVNGGLAYTVKNRKQDRSIGDIRTEKILSVDSNMVFSPTSIGWGARVGIDRDKNIARLQMENKIANSFVEVSMQILEAGTKDGKFFVNAESIRKMIQERYDVITEKELQKAEKNIIHFFQMYDGLVMNEGIKTMIAKEVSKAVTLAWSNQKVEELNKV